MIFHSMLKKIFLSVCLSLGFVAMMPVFAQNTFPYADTTENIKKESTVDLKKDIKAGVVDDKNSVLNQLLKVFGIDNIPGADSKQPATNYVRMLMNIVLGLASFVALVMLIMAFYNMFFSDQEKGADSARKTILGVTYAIFILGLSWFIISFIFNIFNTVKDI